MLLLPNNVNTMSCDYKLKPRIRTGLHTTTIKPYSTVYRLSWKKKRNEMLIIRSASSSSKSR